MYLFPNGINLSLILFAIALIVYIWYSFAIIYHLIRFGIGVKPKMIALTFFIGSFLLFTLIIVVYRQVPWLEIGQNISF